MSAAGAPDGAQQVLVAVAGGEIEAMLGRPGEDVSEIRVLSLVSGNVTGYKIGGRYLVPSTQIRVA